MKDQLTPIKRTRAALLPSATAALLANLLLAPASYGTLTINAVEDNENGVVVFEAEAGSSLNLDAWTVWHQGTAAGDLRLLKSSTSSCCFYETIAMESAGVEYDGYRWRPSGERNRPNWLTLDVENREVAPGSVTGFFYFHTTTEDGGDSDLLKVPAGYVSGTPFPALSMSFPGTLASLGLNPGSYVWSWGQGDSADSFILNIIEPDANGDGIPDSGQDNVVSVANVEDGQSMTLASPDGTTLQNVSSVMNPAPDSSLPPVPEAEIPLGFLSFEVAVVAGAASTVEILLPPGTTVNQYWKYGVEPGNPTTAHWYLFDYDAVTGTGAKFFPDRVVLHFVDGSRGDDDLMANGIIVDPGVFVDVPQVAIPVTIDIKPGSPENTVNLGSQGVTKVAILSTEEFDATTVLPATVRLADALVKVKGNGQPLTTIQDVNNDGFADLVLHMETEGFELTDGDTEATLTGLTFGGEAIEGTDIVRVVP